ncbi:High affinity copper uptake protein 1 [Orchesella cincta]|uniref:Copper transport protein n=1 Tax=Orchesella cincta TaxID=48709 RepID=A0A1D2NKS5_ORCCI|nr:High affinity copper uptake protein 1 [Orchesella cincta]
MESAFWNGYVLQNFVISNLSINSVGELIGLCVVTSALAIVVEGIKTLRDWSYLKFLNQKNSHGTLVVGGDSSIVLQDVKPIQNGSGGDTNGREGSVMNNERNGNHENGSRTGVSGTPVISAGTVTGMMTKNRKRPKFHVGLPELLFSTVLHMCQVCLGYVLMLFVMTFNIWIFVAVLIGLGIGFFVFDGFNKKIHALKINLSQ